MLFELFQNADDAAVELGGDAEPGFAVRAGESSLTAVHQGRPVNRAGEKVKADTAARDLRKMLALGHSDKGDGGLAVTGRFGLGFKSVFLIADAPRLLSGTLAVEILAGLYPRTLGDADQTELRDALERAGLSRDAGTAIDLPLRDGVTVAEIAENYCKLAAYLCVFARATRRCGWIGAAGFEQAQWNAAAGCDLGGLAVTGCLTALAAGQAVTPRRVLVLRAGRDDDTAALLFGLDAHGVTPLAEEVPTVWVTAPTGERHDLGYAVNGPFALDVGRSLIAWEDAETATTFAQLGSGFGDALIAAFDACEQDWDSARPALGLAVSDQLAFWRSLWDVVSQTRAAKDPLRAMAWGRHGFAARLYRERRALPTGVELDGHRVLTCVGDVRAILADELAQGSILDKVAPWPSFKSLAPGSAVTAQVWGRLRELGPDWVPEPERIGLAALIGRELGDDVKFDPDRAASFGGVKGHLNKGVLALLRVDARFQTRDGKWVPAKDLLLAHGDDANHLDERMRAAFTPPERVLADQYAVPAIEFFLACREQMHATVANGRVGDPRRVARPTRGRAALPRPRSASVPVERGFADQDTGDVAGADIGIPDCRSRADPVYRHDDAVRIGPNHVVGSGRARLVHRHAAK